MDLNHDSLVLSMDCQHKASWVHGVMPSLLISHPVPSASLAKIQIHQTRPCFSSLHQFSFGEFVPTAAHLCTWLTAEELDMVFCCCSSPNLRLDTLCMLTMLIKHFHLQSWCSLFILARLWLNSRDCCVWGKIPEDQKCQNSNQPVWHQQPCINPVLHVNINWSSWPV